MMKYWQLFSNAEPSQGWVGGVSCCELIAAATCSWPQQLLCKSKTERGGREESDVNERRFGEDNTLGELMHTTSSVPAPYILAELVFHCSFVTKFKRFIQHDRSNDSSEGAKDAESNLPQATVPFIGGNLLLSNLVHVKTGHIIRKDFYSFPMLSCGSWSEAQQRGSMVEAAHGDSPPFGEGCLVGSWSLRRFSYGSPVVQTAVRRPWDKRWRAIAEEAHFCLKGVLSPPIISHCPVEG
ncbi:hypothetical protein Q8A73_018399 [Channa argus]|nr:hypothetical protein Q8A73_018399 [Channa argus]